MTISCDGGVSFCRWGGVNGHPQGDVLRPQTFCLVCLVEGGPSLLPFCPSQSAGFLSEGVLACLLACCGKNRSLSGRQHPTSLSGAPVSCHLEGTSGSLSRLTVAWSV